METDVYTFATEPAIGVYHSLLDVALKRCPVGLVVFRPEMPLSSRGANVLERLRPFLVHEERATEWPGTRLIGETAIVYKFVYIPESVEILKVFSTRLFDWLQPELPEDLCLLKSADVPWLVTIAHEHDAYLNLEPGELEAMAIMLPEIMGILRKG